MAIAARSPLTGSPHRSRSSVPGSSFSPPFDFMSVVAVFAFFVGLLLRRAQHRDRYGDANRDCQGDGGQRQPTPRGG